MTKILTAFITHAASVKGALQLELMAQSGHLAVYMSLAYHLVARTACMSSNGDSDEIKYN